MQQFGRASDHCTVSHTDRLQAQADAEDGHASAEPAHQIDADSGVLGRPRAGRQQDPVVGAHPVVGRETLVVVAPDVDLGPDLGEVVDDVVDERVVVVDDEDAYHEPNYVPRQRTLVACWGSGPV